jgi:hypothetical protein
MNQLRSVDLIYFGAKFGILADRKAKGVGNATKGFHWKKKWAHVAMFRQ